MTDLCYDDSAKAACKASVVLALQEGHPTRIAIPFLLKASNESY
jgi:hypothetical protein